MQATNGKVELPEHKSTDSKSLDTAQLRKSRSIVHDDGYHQMDIREEGSDADVDDMGLSTEAVAEPSISDAQSIDLNSLLNVSTSPDLLAEGALAEEPLPDIPRPSVIPPGTTSAPAVVFDQTTGASNSASQPDALARERTVWQESKNGWFTVQLARSDDIYMRSPTTYTNVLLRNFAYAVEDRRGLQELRMRDLQAPDVKALDVRIRVGIEESQAFWSDITTRWRPFFDAVTALPLASWEQVSPRDLATEYRWFDLAYEFVSIQLDTLDNLVTVTRETEHPPKPDVVAESTMSATLGPQLRGMSETSETRVREYFRTAAQRGHTPLRSQATAERGAAAHGLGPRTVHDSLSSANSYKTNIAMLAGVSFFGASVAWSAVFQGSRGDVVVLAWSSSLFVCASVAAGAIAIILGSETIDLDRDMNARRALRAFVIISAVFIVGGIILLSIAQSLLDLSSGDDDQGQQTGTLSRVIALRASGIFTIVVVLVEMAVALLLRRALTPGRYKW